MSCYHPITINNPKLVKNSVYDRSLIEVPCGHCAACKDVKRLSWFVRLYYEWQFCVDNGGFVLYETLTYNEENLPYLVLHGDRYLCFSVRDVQLYLKKVRKYIFRHYGNDISFKYFLSMEYGGKTHRPHYHILFFVSSNKINCNDFKKLVEDYWCCNLCYIGVRKKPDYSKGNGFVKAGKYNRGFVTGVGALNYCAKYVCKDIYEEVYFRKLGLKFQMLGVDKSQLKDFFPHTMQSNNLGAYALEFDKNNDLSNFFDGTIILPDKDNIKKLYKLPLYYERKIFYTVKYRYFDILDSCYYSVDNISSIPYGVEYSPIYVLNDLGIEMKQRRYQKSIDAVRNVYRVCMSLPNYLPFIKNLNEKFNKSFLDIKSFQTYIEENLSEENFVAFSLVYRGCACCYNRQPVSIVDIDVYRDFSLIHNMSRGVRPLSVDFNHLCNDIDIFSHIPNISDNYNMIRFLFYLVNLEFEDFKNKKEQCYVDQKTSFLALNEHIV